MKYPEIDDEYIFDWLKGYFDPSILFSNKFTGSITHDFALHVEMMFKEEMFDFIELRENYKLQIIKQLNALQVDLKVAGD